MKVGGGLAANERASTPTGKSDEISAAAAAERWARVGGALS